MRGALVSGDLLFYGFDTFYHMRRILFTFENFPTTLWFDPWINYPKGLELLWPPLFDEIVAGAALLLGAGSQRSVEVVAAAVPPILGSLTIVSVYLLARELFGRRIGLLSALFFAINPQHVSTTIFARPDHHVLESFILVNLVLLLALALRRGEGWPRLGAAAGILVGALAYTWIGAAAYIGAFLAFAAIAVTLNLRRGVSSREDLQVFLLVFGVALALVLPFWREAWMLPSSFAIAAVLLTTAILLVISQTFLARGIPWIALLPLLLLLGYLFLLSVYALEESLGVHHLLVQGLGYFFGGVLTWKVAEAAPLYDVVRPASVVGFNLTVAVLGFAHLWRSDIDRPQLLFLLWTVSVLVLAVFQNRFLYVFSASMAILMALFFFRAAGIVADSGWARRRRDISEYFAPALLLLLLVPSAMSVGEVFSIRPAVVELGWSGPLDWLEERSIEGPGEGVLAWWDRGNWVLYRSRWPVVANGFQTGAEDAARFFLSGDEAAALEILDMRRARYVVTDSNLLGTGLSAMVLWTGEDPSEYLGTAGECPDGTGKFLNTTLARCHLFDCREMSHLRLVYESDPRDGANQVKIFERVVGARIRGACPGGGAVTLSLNLTTNQGRPFCYTKRAAPKAGRYEMIIPYSTEGDGSVGRSHIASFGGESRTIRIDEDDVLRGGVITVDL
ncbi:MAG: Dolichyl-monophosphooligosaccharide--protein glycosyltransferase AglB [Methanosaeta sp. PtaU1.Bin055]|jgi:dolichyl-diphosphooligosaccharide--protein glycosyltransferase|nr:MAG: Dolichyl-monophosphooligosaccharide--protein glycosyltransferase AglB [Methanosaeta sp. PtaU1.Bin055]